MLAINKKHAQLTEVVKKRHWFPVKLLKLRGHLCGQWMTSPHWDLWIKCRSRTISGQLLSHEEKGRRGAKVPEAN